MLSLLTPRPLQEKLAKRIRHGEVEENQKKSREAESYSEERIRCRYQISRHCHQFLRRLLCQQPVVVMATQPAVAAGVEVVDHLSSAPLDLSGHRQLVQSAVGACRQHLRHPLPARIRNNNIIPSEAMRLLLRYPFSASLHLRLPLKPPLYSEAWN